MPSRLAPEREQEIILAYEAWEGDDVTSLVKGLGISRQTLYSVLERNGIKLKSQRRYGTDQVTAALGELLPDNLIDRMADRALHFVLNELVQLRQQRDTLRQAIGVHLEKNPDRRLAKVLKETSPSAD